MMGIIGGGEKGIQMSPKVGFHSASLDFFYHQKNIETFLKPPEKSIYFTTYGFKEFFFIPILDQRSNYIIWSSAYLILDHS